MSHDLDSLADGLVMETLADTAQTFFGARKGLETEIEIFQAKQRELAEVERRVRRRAGLLHRLLLDADTARRFYGRLGVDGGEFVDAVDPEYRSADFKIPFALTARGRFVKAVARAYAGLASAMDDYLHGRYVNDPEGSGRKVMTANYELLSQWCERINRRIENVNQTMSPSGTMCFVRGLDPGQEARERVTGATIEGRACSLDSDLAFKALPGMVVDQAVFPDLPDPAKARGEVKRAAREVWSSDAAQARRALAEVAAS